jgi:hypothetical protein
LEIAGLNKVKGGIALEGGCLLVEYEKGNGKTKFKVTLPSGVNAKFKYKDAEFDLKVGENLFEI